MEYAGRSGRPESESASEVRSAAASAGRVDQSNPVCGPSADVWGAEDSRLTETSGLSCSTIRVGFKDLEAGLAQPRARVRRSTDSGGKAAAKRAPSSAGALGCRPDPAIRQDRRGPSRLICHGAERLAQGVTAEVQAVSEQAVERTPHGPGYRPPANRRTLTGEGPTHAEARLLDVSGQACQ